MRRRGTILAWMAVTSVRDVLTWPLDRLTGWLLRRAVVATRRPTERWPT